MPNPYAQHNERNKANFDHVYDLPDPRGYFETLGSLDCLAPEHGRRLFPTLLRELGTGGGPEARTSTGTPIIVRTVVRGLADLRRSVAPR